MEQIVVSDFTWCLTRGRAERQRPPLRTGRSRGPAIALIFNREWWSVRGREAQRGRLFLKFSPELASEATAGIEPAMKVLQTSALPLGYVADDETKSTDSSPLTLF